MKREHNDTDTHLCLVIRDQSDINQANRSGLIGVSEKDFPPYQMSFFSDGQVSLENLQLAVVGTDKQCKERISITRELWDILLSDGNLHTLKEDVASSANLELALRIQIDIFQNFYKHEECEVEWDDKWSCACDDECPECGTSISPNYSKQLRWINPINDDLLGVSYYVRPELKMQNTPVQNEDNILPLKPRMRI